MAQLNKQIERAGRAEALADTKAGLFAAERALSVSLALEISAYEDWLKRQVENSAANIVQLGDEINFLTRQLVSLQARHEAKAAVLRHTSSTQSQLLWAAKATSDLTILSLRKQLQQEADQNRATNQVACGVAAHLSAQGVYDERYKCSARVMRLPRSSYTSCAPSCLM